MRSAYDISNISSIGTPILSRIELEASREPIGALMEKDKGIITSDDNVRKTRGSSKPEVLMPVPASLLEMPAGYAAFFAELKERIAHERIKAVLSANSAMVLIIWISAGPFLNVSTKTWGNGRGKSWENFQTFFG